MSSVLTKHIHEIKKNKNKKNIYIILCGIFMCQQIGNLQCLQIACYSFVDVKHFFILSPPHINTIEMFLK